MAVEERLDGPEHDALDGLARSDDRLALTELVEDLQVEAVALEDHRDGRNAEVHVLVERHLITTDGGPGEPLAEQVEALVAVVDALLDPAARPLAVQRDSGRKASEGLDGVLAEPAEARALRI